MPYAFELNDSLAYTVERQSSPELFTRIQDTVATFEPELPSQPRVLTLGLHPHQIGVPHRIGYLARGLRLLQERNDVVFMTGGAIADWYRAVEPPTDLERTPPEGPPRG
jgi:hypothetical protein